MSQNKTDFLGMLDNRDLYARKATPHKGTVLPELNKLSGGGKVVDNQSEGEPIAGFLYSVSRTAGGEYWPLHFGENTIGRAEDCDICLREMTVSEHHATLYIRKMKTKPDFIVDLEVRGKNSGFVNNEEVGRESVACKDRDFLTIGDNYVLFLILLNPFELGMQVAENFLPAEEEAKDFPPAGPHNHPGRTDDLYNPANRVENGTMTLDGASDVNYGHTQVLK